MTTRRGVIVLAAGAVATGCVGKGKVVHPSDNIEVPRQVLVQARGKVAAIYLRVRALEKDACKHQRLSAAQCSETDRLDEQWSRDQREVDALMAQPHYEVDWTKFLRTLDAVGSIVDKLPIP
jgi:hypothetical protein